MIQYETTPYLSPTQVITHVRRAFFGKHTLGDAKHFEGREKKYLIEYECIIELNAKFILPRKLESMVCWMWLVLAHADCQQLNYQELSKSGNRTWVA